MESCSHVFISSRYEDFVLATKCNSLWPNRYPHLETRKNYTLPLRGYASARGAKILFQPQSAILCGQTDTRTSKSETIHPPTPTPNSNSTNHKSPSTHSPTTKISYGQTQTLVQGRSNPRTGQNVYPSRAGRQALQGRAHVLSTAAKALTQNTYCNM